MANETESKTSKDADNTKILLTLLETEWQDHFNIRNQTWKSVIASGALIVGLVSMPHTDIKSIFTILGCIGLTAISVLGILVALHHRQCEKEKLSYICAIEKLLHIHKENKDAYTFFSEQKHSRIKTADQGFNTTKFIIGYHSVVLLLCLIGLHLMLVRENCIVIYNFLDKSSMW